MTIMLYEKIRNELKKMQTSNIGEKDVCMGVPVKITCKGIKKIQSINLNKSEKELFKKSAQTIRNNIKSVRKLLN